MMIVILIKKKDLLPLDVHVLGDFLSWLQSTSLLSYWVQLIKDSHTEQITWHLKEYAVYFYRSIWKNFNLKH